MCNIGQLGILRNADTVTLITLQNYNSNADYRCCNSVEFQPNRRSVQDKNKASYLDCWWKFLTTDKHELPLNINDARCNVTPHHNSLQQTEDY